MNKLKLISIALVCALGLGVTSCVDDNESASVENVRNAKASLMNAKAELDKANAQARLLEANAKAAMDNAEAAFRQAQADQEKAKADIAKATLETDIAAAKLSAQAALDAAKKLQLTNAGEYVTQLWTLYETSVQNVYGATFNKIDAQQSLLSAKYRLDNFDVLVAQQTTNLNLNIAYSNALIAEYQKISDKGTQELNNAIIAAQSEQNRLDKEVTQTNNAASLAQTVEKGAIEALVNTDYAKAARLFEDYDGGSLTVIKSANYQAKATGNASDNSDITAFGTSISYITGVDNNEVAKYIIEQEELVKDVKAAFTDVDTTYAKLLAAEDKAFITYDTAKTDKDNYKAAYETARQAAADYKVNNNYDVKQAAQKEEVEMLAAMKTAKAALSNYATVYQPALDAAKAKSLAYAQARVAANIKGQDLAVVNQLVSDLGGILNNQVSVEELIALEQARIKDYQEQLANISYQGETEEGWALVVAQYEWHVSFYEGLIVKYQADADRYKALLDAEADKK